MSEVLRAVKHYQNDIERCGHDENRVLHCIERLLKLPVTVQHLQDTGVGRTVNALRKADGEVAAAARSLVAKWKLMVAEEEREEENEAIPINNGGYGYNRDRSPVLVPKSINKTEEDDDASVQTIEVPDSHKYERHKDRKREPEVKQVKHKEERFEVKHERESDGRKRKIKEMHNDKTKRLKKENIDNRECSPVAIRGSSSDESSSSKSFHDSLSPPSSPGRSRSSSASSSEESSQPKRSIKRDIKFKKSSPKTPRSSSSEKNSSGNSSNGDESPQSDDSTRSPPKIIHKQSNEKSSSSKSSHDKPKHSKSRSDNSEQLGHSSDKSHLDKHKSRSEVHSSDKKHSHEHSSDKDRHSSNKERHSSSKDRHSSSKDRHSSSTNKHSSSKEKQPTEKSQHSTSKNKHSTEKFGRSRNDKHESRSRSKDSSSVEKEPHPGSTIKLPPSKVETNDEKSRHSSITKKSSSSKDIGYHSSDTEKHSNDRGKSSSKKDGHSSSSVKDSGDKHHNSIDGVKHKDKHSTDRMKHSNEVVKHSPEEWAKPSSDRLKQSADERVKHSSEKDISSEREKHKKHSKNKDKEKHTGDREKHSRDREKQSTDKHKSSHSSKVKKSSSSSSSSLKTAKEIKTDHKPKEVLAPPKIDKRIEEPEDRMTDKKKKKLREAFIDGIDCESGASFAEALGMVSPSKSSSSGKKKSIVAKESKKETIDKGLSASSSSADRSSSSTKPRSSNPPIDSTPSLLQPGGLSKLPPLSISVSALPDISPHYTPRPAPKLLDFPFPHLSEEEALSTVMYNKNQRTKVFSGNKVLHGAIPSLYELCVIVLQENIDALEYTGGVPYDLLKPVVDKANPDQLMALEHFNPYLIEDTDPLWQSHCSKHFRSKRRQEMETWRDMYQRCLEEQAEKLKLLTKNIKLSQDKSTPVRQTKLAYVDSVAKPPRNVARSQAIYGTASKAVASPAARVASLSGNNVVNAVAVKGVGASIQAPPSRSSSGFLKPKKAPLMQKALQLIKGRYKR